MGKQKWQTDKELAEKICDELLKGNGRAILSIYNEYHNILLAFFNKHLRDPMISRVLTPEEVMNEFWSLILKRTSIVCEYKGNSSLKTYLINVLKNYVKDIKKSNNIQNALKTENVAFIWDDNDIESVTIIDKKLHNAIQSNILDKYMSQNWINTSICKDDKKSTSQILLRKALKILSIERPEDARLIGYKLLHDLSYDEIVDRYYPSEDKKKRQTIKNRLKKRFERARGYFRDILCRCLAEEGMELADLFG